MCGISPIFEVLISQRALERVILPVMWEQALLVLARYAPLFPLDGAPDISDHGVEDGEIGV